MPLNALQFGVVQVLPVTPQDGARFTRISRSGSQLIVFCLGYSTAVPQHVQGPRRHPLRRFFATVWHKEVMLLMSHCV